MQLPILPPSYLCGSCSPTSSFCPCTHPYFLTPAPIPASPTAWFQPVESALPQFQSRERGENVNNLFTSSAHFCNNFWQASLCHESLSFTLLLVTFLKHRLDHITPLRKHLQWPIESWNVQDCSALPSTVWPHCLSFFSSSPPSPSFLRKNKLLYYVLKKEIIYEEVRGRRGKTFLKSLLRCDWHTKFCTYLMYTTWCIWT